MDVTTEMIGTAQVVHIAGRLDHTSSTVLDARLRELLDAGHTRLVLDVEQMSYISSAGLRSLILVAKEVKTRSGALALASVPLVGTDHSDIRRHHRPAVALSGKLYGLRARN